MDANDARRAHALPIFGGAKLPEGVDADHKEDGQSAGTLLKLLFRAWPFLDRYISGRWLKIGITAKPSETELSETSGGFLYAPVLFTLIVAFGTVGNDFLGVRTSTPDVQFWSMIGRFLVAGLSVCAWSTWYFRGRLQTIVGIAGVIFGFLAISLYAGALRAPAAQYFVIALWLTYLAGWFIRFEVQNGGLVMGVRLQSHVLYHFIGTWAMRTLTALVGIFTTDLLVTSILLGAPLTPTLAALIGKQDLARGVVEGALTAAQRTDLLFNYFSIAFAMFLVTLALSRTLLPYYSIWIQQKINQDLRIALVERWHRLSMRYHADQRVGDSVYRIYQDSAQITVVISRLISFITLGFALVSALFVLCFFDLRLAAVAAIIVLPGVLWANWFAPRMRARSLVARQTNSSLTSRIQEILSGLRVIKAYGREEVEQKRFESDSVIAFNAAYKARTLVAVTTIITFTMTAAVLLPGEYFMAVWANQNREIAAGALMAMIGLSFTNWNLAAFNWVKNQFFETATDVRLISREWAIVQDTAMGLYRVFDILDIEPDVQDAPDAHPMAPFTDEVRFENVSFSYADDRPILEDISFSAKAGTITAIVGPTGSGKSTMMSLLLRLFDPDRGRITIDGCDLRDLKVESLRDNVSIALQENILFAMSVKDNIRYVHPEAPDAQVAAAAAIACADEFIADLPDGYETFLGDRGGKLSTGQRQRLSIARALMKDTPILILDEPTAALDAGTEHRVMRNLASWGKGRAIFVITHRLSTIRQADQILFLHDGRIQEAGRHDELMRDPSGRYHDMVRAESAHAASETV